MLYACFAPDWFTGKSVQTHSLEEALSLNERGYNVYWYPNYPSVTPDRWVESADVDTFEWVFVDMDLKDGIYRDKEQFIDTLTKGPMPPTWIVDSGNGIHAYYRVVDLDAMSFLRLSRRLMRVYETDDAVQKLKQVMRLPDTDNTKEELHFKRCREISFDNIQYTCEQMDKLLPPITMEDEEYCQTHYNKAYAIPEEIKIEDKLPQKFGDLLNKSSEVKKIFHGDVPDRSVGDMRLGHILFANKFTKEEAMSVLVNVPKALERGPRHRVSYAQNIVDKIWTYETKPEFKGGLSKSVRDILSAPVDTVEGIRFPCWNWLDGTEYGFRLGHVVGLIAGVGVGKTSVALNMFMGFVKLNPSFVHIFTSLEQPPEEIAKRWRRMCGDDTSLYDKVHIIGNYNDDGSFRHLSLTEIKDYILQFQIDTGQKVGCVVVDHLGVLKMKDGNGENQRIVDLCHELKPFAQMTNTLFVIQSQVPREKAGIGDLEISKDGAYGSMMFESYLDTLLSCWQPLKRAYKDGAPLVTAYKFCKIRHKNALRDRVKEDVCYKMAYDPETECFRYLTQDEEKSFVFHLKGCTEKRKADRKTELVEYTSLNNDNTKH